MTDSRTESRRGEALPEIAGDRQQSQGCHTYAHLFDAPQPRLGWHVLWTRSNFERLVHDQLQAKGYDVFLPTLQQWSRDRRGQLQCLLVPMFKGYLFLHHAVDKPAYIDICSTKGLASILGSRWDRLAYVPDREVETIQLAVASRRPAAPYPYLEEGDKVRIATGSLANAEGILVRNDADKGLFIVSVNLLRRSIAVEVDCTEVVPA